MGYYTYYTMEARNIKDEKEYYSIVHALKECELFEDEENDKYGVFNESKYDSDFHTAYFDVYEECKWYDHTYDMTKFSKLFPNVTFKLHGDGEERDDMWNEYFHNGVTEECRAQIIYDTPCEIEWEE